jgi:predicted RNase H-like HicB family nuclease
MSNITKRNLEGNNYAMKTINHEYYVSLEVAKLLKEAGFDWEVKTYYHYLSPYDEYNLEFDSISTNYNHLNNADFSAPTLDVTQRWLREEKGWILETHHFGEEYFEMLDDGYYVETEDDFIHKYPNKSFYMCYGYFENCLYIEEDGNTYEEALEAGIKKALELILEKGKVESLKDKNRNTRKNKTKTLLDYKVGEELLLKHQNEEFIGVIDFKFDSIVKIKRKYPFPLMRDDYRRKNTYEINPKNIGDFEILTETLKTKGKRIDGKELTENTFRDLVDKLWNRRVSGYFVFRDGEKVYINLKQRINAYWDLYHDNCPYGESIIIRYNEYSPGRFRNHCTYNFRTGGQAFTDNGFFTEKTRVYERDIIAFEYE